MQFRYAFVVDRQGLKVLDVTDLEMTQAGQDRVRVEGAKARPRTATYKVTVGYDDGYIGEGQISYAGIHAVEKAKWAAEIVQQLEKAVLETAPVDALPKQFRIPP